MKTNSESSVRNANFKKKNSTVFKSHGFFCGGREMREECRTENKKDCFLYF